MSVLPLTTQKGSDLSSESLPGEHRAQFVATGSEFQLAQNDASPGLKLGGEMNGLTLDATKPEITPREHLTLLKQLHGSIPEAEREKFLPAKMRSSAEELLTTSIDLKGEHIKSKGVSVAVSVATYDTKGTTIGENGETAYQYSSEHAENPIRIEVQKGDGKIPQAGAHIPTRVIFCDREEFPARLKEVLDTVGKTEIPDDYFTHERILTPSEDGTYPLVERTTP